MLQPGKFGLTEHVRCVYDAWSRLVRVEDKDGSPVLADFERDALGRILRNGVAREHYFYSEAWQLLTAVHEEEPNVRRREYVWGPRYVDELCVSYAAYRDPPRRYHLQDTNWNVVATLGVVSGVMRSLEAIRYDPYGLAYFYDANANWTGYATPPNDWESPEGTDVAFQGRWYWKVEAPGEGRLRLYDFRHRTYAPKLGRFLQRDPLSTASAANSYQAMRGNTLKFTDPSGQQDQGWAGLTRLDPKEYIVEVRPGRNRRPARPSDCNVYVFWGHKHDVEKAEYKVHSETCCWAQGLLGCRTRPATHCPIGGFPNCKEGNIGYSGDYCREGAGAASLKGNAGLNPTVKPVEGGREPRTSEEALKWSLMGFNELLGVAWGAAEETGEDICCRCCQCDSVTIGFYCVSSDRGNRELLGRMQYVLGSFEAALDEHGAPRYERKAVAPGSSPRQILRPRYYCGKKEAVKCDEVRARGCPSSAGESGVTPAAGGK